MSFYEHMGISEDIYRNELDKKALITPPEKNDIGNKRFRFLIDSRDRNLTLYPTPSYYRYDFLQENFTDVESIRLVSAKVPFSQYMIHNGNNAFYVSTSIPLINSDGYYTYESVQKLSIPNGDYTESSLTSVLAALLSDALSTTLIVTYDVVSNKYTFVTSAPIIPFAFICMGKDTMYGSSETLEAPDLDTDGSFKYDSNGQIVMKRVTTTQTQHKYISSTVAKALGFGAGNYGTFSGTTFATQVLDDGIGQSTITYNISTGVSVVNELKVGDSVIVYDYTDHQAPKMLDSGLFVINGLNSSTGVLTLNGTLTTTSNDIRISKTYIKSTYKAVLEIEPYIILKIDRGGNINSNNQTALKSFALLTTNNGATSDSFAIIPNTQTSQNNFDMMEMPYTKSFKPVIQNLAFLTFKFMNYDGSLYDFQNRDHYLELLITTSSQNSKYGAMFK